MSIRYHFDVSSWLFGARMLRGLGKNRFVECHVGPFYVTCYYRSGDSRLARRVRSIMEKIR